MRLALGQLGLGLGLALLWASACGGNTGRNGRGDEPVAGESHAPSAPGRGGAQAGRPGSTGGASNLGEAGQPTTTQGGSPGVAGAPAASGGAPTVAAGGVASGGAPASYGGEGGAPSECCQPLDCDDILNGVECGTNRYSDGCGQTFRCDCDDGLVCEEGSCVACDPGAEPCAEDQTLCGQTLDRCGNSVVCPDNCSTLTATGSCYQGRCCTPSQTGCSADDCGQMLIGCGQALDCTDTVCPSETTCQLSGKCCKPTAVCTPSNCGFKADGCGNYLDCAYVCPQGTLCLENECVFSECQAETYQCGQAYNVEADALEYCGTCPNSGACRDNFCLPRCVP